MAILALLGQVDSRRRELEFPGLTGGWTGFFLFVALFAIVALIFFLYAREGRAGAGAALRRGLATLRTLVLVGLGAIWLEPVIATYLESTRDAHVVVAYDVSASMEISDAENTGATAATRIDRVRTLLNQDDHAWLRALDAQNPLNLYVFGDDMARRPLPWELAADAEPPTLSVPPSPTAPIVGDTALRNRTDLGQAVVGALKDLGQEAIAGVILITDGANNKGMAPDAIVSYARRKKARLYTVGVGAAAEPPNLRVTGLSAPPTVRLGDPFELRVDCAAGGLPGATSRLQLARVIDESAAMGESPVEARDITFAQDRPTVPHTFQITPTTAGEQLYRVRLDTVAGEAVTSDNVREIAVQVLDERFRVLIVAGRPSFDYRHLVRMLERDKSVDVSCWLQSADPQAIRDGNTVITELPRSTESLFAYDCILLMDPNPAEFDSAWAVAVRRFVDEFGGGLLVEAGPHFTSRFLRDVRMEDLVSLLPVVPDPDADVWLGERGAFRPDASTFEVPRESLAHPLVSFSNEPTTNEAIWTALPGVFWYYPVQRAKPIATVLTQHSNPSQRTVHGPAVLFATQPTGAGRTVYLGFDSSWRWRATAEPYFTRFWTQIIRYLAQPRREGGSKRGTILLDREIVEAGDFVKIEARVLDNMFAPWLEPTTEAQIRFGDDMTRRTVRMNAIPDRPGWFAARVLFEIAGPAMIEVPLPPNDDEETMLARRVRVQQPDVEMETLRLRADLLRTLADRTGGAYRPIADAHELTGLITNASETIVTRGAQPESLWDRWWVMAILAGLLALEWTLRRRNHLL